jgi:hypothetical protein
LRSVLRRAEGALAHLSIADHHPAHVLDGRSLGIALAGQPAAPQNREMIAEGFHLAELVGDHQHGDFAALGHAAQQAEHFVGLARGQHRGRLVEDHETLVEIEQFQDFELLLFARRQR